MDEIAYAMIFQRLLPAIIGVLIFAFVGRSRVVFLLCMLGLLLGFVVPQPRTYADYASVEAAYLAALYDRVNHVATWSTAGAIGGTLCGYLFLLWSRREIKGEEQKPGCELSA